MSDEVRDYVTRPAKVKLGDVVEINTDTPPSYDGVKNYISTGAVQDNGVDVAQVEQWGYLKRPSRANLYPAEGDVLFAKMQATRKVIVVTSEIAGSLFSTGFYALRVKPDRLDRGLLVHYLKSDSFNCQKDRECKGATQKALNGSGFDKLTLKLPSISEQKKLVARLDVTCGLIAKRKEQLAKLNQLVKSEFAVRKRLEKARQLYRAKLQEYFG